jgi:hypothetical protein
MSGNGYHVTGGIIVMDANYQTDSLWPLAGQDVALNIGLGKGSSHSIVGVPHRLRTITKLLPVVMEPGYRGELVLAPKHVWVGEPMLIVQGTFQHNIHRWLAMWGGLVAAEQDCIAIYCPEKPELSRLFGPRSEEWGAFNINFFHFIWDKHE